MSEDRQPVTTAVELLSMSDEEITEGYYAGREGEPEPGNNRSKAFWHGWGNGNNDRNHTSDYAQIMLIRDLRANNAPPFGRIQ